MFGFLNRKPISFEVAKSHAEWMWQQKQEFGVEFVDDLLKKAGYFGVAMAYHPKHDKIYLCDSDGGFHSFNGQSWCMEIYWK